MLDDGRVGALLRYDDLNAEYLVFVEQGGRWLIDEALLVTDNPGAG